MYASIRKYKSYKPDEVAKKVQDYFVPMISETEGFVSYELILADGHFLSITVYETEANAIESNLAALNWVNENIPQLVEGELEVSAGELIAHSHHS